MKRRSPWLAAITFLITFLLCLLGLLVVNLTLVIPRLAAQTFGLPSSSLAYPQQLTYAALLVLQSDELTLPRDPGGSERPFKVGLGEPAASVIQRLYEDRLIGSPDAFRTYLLYSGLDTSLQAGDYNLSPAMSALDIAHRLQDATPEHVTFRILAGWRLEEIAAALPTSGLSISPEEFLAAARLPRTGYVFSGQLSANASLEGFFSPDTYELPRTLTLEGFIRAALDRTQASLTPELGAGFSAHGLDIYQAVTLASIVEREAVQDQEMPFIASVFYNRLAAGMKLDTDPTVQYAIGFNPEQNTWWTNPLSRQNLDLDSPYNTYLYPGLPPGPICSPGMAALEAVANPEESPYFYFRAACDGSGRHVFSTTYEEHLGNACP